jgi:ArsR family transcriptional regulator, lead/cadmium/zinc/bismuth-responsive transcriptional repressor
MIDQQSGADCCERTAIHEDVVRLVRGRMQQEAGLSDLAELFKIFADLTRVRILSALFENELCVCDIACLLEMTQSAISHQLRVLKQARLVRSRKAGKVVYYSLADDHVRQIIDQGLNHVHEEQRLPIWPVRQQEKQEEKR